MKSYLHDEHVFRQLSAIIEALPPRPHHAGLLEALSGQLPGMTFRHVLSRGGWYRAGRVLSADGLPVADSVESWALAGLTACGGELEEMVDRHCDQGLLVTRHTGRTHYFVAHYSPSPADFLQLEVEELHEVLDRHLFDPDNLPTDWQELVEPSAPKSLEAQGVAAPRYRFRRFLDARQTIARAVGPGQIALNRMLSEWSYSSAATRGHFCQHWLLGVREHLDRYCNPQVAISLISAHTQPLHLFPWDTHLSGVDMAAQLHAFDRAAAYPAAWYFGLIARHLTPLEIAYQLARDVQSGFRYLPDSDVALLQAWLDKPYTVAG